jgi:hypothetical protein
MGIGIFTIQPEPLDMTEGKDDFADAHRLPIYFVPTAGSSVVADDVHAKSRELLAFERYYLCRKK